MDVQVNISLHLLHQRGERHDLGLVLRMRLIQEALPDLSRTSVVWQAAGQPACVWLDIHHPAGSGYSSEVRNN